MGRLVGSVAYSSSNQDGWAYPAKLFVSLTFAQKEIIMSGDNALTFLLVCVLLVLGIRNMWRTTFPNDGKIKAEAKKRVTVWIGRLFK
jgi:hypothetical protein